METVFRLGDCKHVLKKLESNSVDLIVTSPPYADARKQTYGGILQELKQKMKCYSMKFFQAKFGK